MWSVFGNPPKKDAVGGVYVHKYTKKILILSYCFWLQIIKHMDTAVAVLNEQINCIVVSVQT